MFHQNQANHRFSTTLEVTKSQWYKSTYSNKNFKEIKRKESFLLPKEKQNLGFEISHPKVNLKNKHMTTRPS